MKNIWNFLCCQLDSDEEQFIEEHNTNLCKKEEKTALELYGNFETLNYMLVRMTQKNFFVDFKMKKHQNQEKNPLSIYFSYNDVKYEQDESKYLIPEKVLQYIARRMREVKPNLIVDGFSRSGINAIQFSSESGTLVFCHNFSNTYIKNCIHNQSICKLNIKCEQVLGKLPQLSIISPDIVFVQPDYEISDNKIDCNNIHPSLQDILQYALNQSTNIILVLPSQINIHEVCEIFSINLKKYNLDVLKMEIQKIQIDGELHYNIFYFGEIAAIQYQDEYAFMTELALEDFNSYTLYDSTQMLLKNVGYTRNSREVMNILIESKQQTSVETTLSSFIHQLMIKGLTNQETIKQLFGQEEYLQSSSTPKINQIQEVQNTFGQENYVFNKQESPGIKTKKKTQFISFNNPSNYDEI